MIRRWTSFSTNTQTNNNPIFAHLKFTSGFLRVSRRLGLSIQRSCVFSMWLNKSHCWDAMDFNTHICLEFLVFTAGVSCLHLFYSLHNFVFVITKIESIWYGIMMPKNPLNKSVLNTSMTYSDKHCQFSIVFIFTRLSFCH